MKSDWLEAFLVFSHTLNFTHAAEQLHISQPALHVKISKLSEYIGKPLYQKVGRNLSLTHEGQLLQAFAREQTEHAQSFLQVLRTGKASQQVCLCAGEGTFLYLLANVISTYTRQSLNRLKIKTGNQQKVISDVLAGEAHIGVTPIDADPENLKSEPFTQVGQMLVMRATHPLAKKSSIKLEDLNGEQLIVPPGDRPHRILINRLLMNAKVEWEAAIEVNGWDLMLNFVQQGLGLAIVNEYCKIPRTLIAKPLKEFPALQFYIVQRRFAGSNASVDELKKILFEHKNKWRTRVTRK